MFESFEDDFENELSLFEFKNSRRVSGSTGAWSNVYKRKRYELDNNEEEEEEEEGDEEKEEEDEEEDENDQEENNQCDYEKMISNDHVINFDFEETSKPIFKTIKLSNSPTNLNQPSRPKFESSSSSLPLRQRLIDLYFNESLKNKSNQTRDKFLNYSTNLLEKLVKSENFNTIVLNFYAPSKGFSIGFNIKPQLFKTNSLLNECDLNKLETKYLSYDETEILFYVNVGEIPPILIDLIDRINVKLFYDGCLIMEIRDYRRRRSQMSTETNNSINEPYDLHFVLLQPSMQTLLADLNSITNDGDFVWTQEDKYTLESQLLIATTQPLCLEPNPKVSILKSKIQRHKLKMSGHRHLKRSLFRKTQVYLNRAAKWQEFDLPFPFQILKIRKKYQTSNDIIPNLPRIVSNNLIKNDPNSDTSSFASMYLNVDNWSRVQPTFKLPRDEMILVKKFAKQPIIDSRHNYTIEPFLNPIEEIILEAVDKNSKNNYSKLLIKRRSSDGIYFCQLTLRPTIISNNRIDPTASLFELGLAHDAEKYIQQYVKIFTEEGRRPVTIKHNLIEKVQAHQSVDQQNHSNNKLIDSTNCNSNKTSHQTEYTPQSSSGNPSSNPNHTPEPIPIASNSTIRKPSNSSPVFRGISFSNYFDSKVKFDFNDKQLLTYQAFLNQQHQQQIQNQSNHQLDMQHQLQQQQQFRRIRSSISDANMTNQNQNINQPMRNTLTAQQHQLHTQPQHSQQQITFKPSDNIKTTTITLTNDLLGSPNSSFNSEKLNITNNEENNLSGKKDDVIMLDEASKSDSQPNQTSTVQTSQSQLNNNLAQKLPNNPTSKVQAKTPTKRQPKKRQNNSTNSNNSNVPASTTTTTMITLTPKIQPKPVAIQPQLAADSRNQNEKPKNVPTIIKSLTQQNASNASTNNSAAKIINASNLNILRKIAIESRAMPLIVTLNSNDNEQQQQSIKLLNSKIMLKPSDTSPLRTTSSMNQSPLKTTNIQSIQLQLPKATSSSSLSTQVATSTSASSPLLKQLSLNTQSSQNNLNTSKINFSIVNNQNNQNQDIVSISNGTNNLMSSTTLANTTSSTTNSMPLTANQAKKSFLTTTSIDISNLKSSLIRTQQATSLAKVSNQQTLPLLLVNTANIQQVQQQLQQQQQQHQQQQQ